MEKSNQKGVPPPQIWDSILIGEGWSALDRSEVYLVGGTRAGWSIDTGKVHDTTLIPPTHTVWCTEAGRKGTTAETEQETLIQYASGLKPAGRCMERVETLGAHFQVQNLGYTVPTKTRYASLLWGHTHHACRCGEAPLHDSPSCTTAVEGETEVPQSQKEKFFPLQCLAVPYIDEA